MHLRHLTLTNVRQFANKTFHFLPGFNLLVGENGAGKTTLLRSIAAVLGPTGGRREVPILIDDDISLHSSDLRIDVDVSHSPDTNATYSYQRQFGARAHRYRKVDLPLLLLYGSNESICKSFVSQRNRGKRSRRSDYRMDFPDEEWLYDELERRPTADEKATRFGNSREIRRFVNRVLSLFSPKFHSFSWAFEPYRCTVRQQEPGPGDLDPRIKKLLANAILRYLEENERPLLTADQSRIVINSSGQVIGDKREMRRRDIVPDFEYLLRRFGEIDAPKANFSQMVAEIHLSPRIRIRTGSGSFLLSQMSDGEKRLFSLFVDIARQLYVSNESLDMRKATAIVLIDEVDVHLHPKWQRQIVPSLEDLFPACQFIATTHSPFVVQGVRESHVQHLGHPIPGDFTDRGIEEIAAKVMGILQHQVSPRYLDMLEAARKYFILLESAANKKGAGDSKAVTAAKIELDRLSGQYARNPAYQAFLELNRDLRLGGGN